MVCGNSSYYYYCCCWLVICLVINYWIWIKDSSSLYTNSTYIHIQTGRKEGNLSYQTLTAMQCNYNINGNISWILGRVNSLLERKKERNISFFPNIFYFFILNLLQNYLRMCLWMCSCISDFHEFLFFILLLFIIFSLSPSH